MESGELLIVDPCYVLREDDQGRPIVRLDTDLGMCVKVALGAATATCSLEKRKLYPGRGGTVAGLAIRLGPASANQEREHFKEAVWVDSATVLVIDPSILKREDGVLAYGDALPPKGQRCGLVLRPPAVQASDDPAVPLGFVTQTEDGDGEYDVWLARNLAGEVAEIFVDFETFWYEPGEEP